MVHNLASSFPFVSDISVLIDSIIQVPRFGLKISRFTNSTICVNFLNPHFSRIVPSISQSHQVRHPTCSSAVSVTSSSSAALAATSLNWRISLWSWLMFCGKTKPWTSRKPVVFPMQSPVECHPHERWWIQFVNCKRLLVVAHYMWDQWDDPDGNNCFFANETFQ